MGTEVWLIRHGESEANAGLATSDPATIKLTPKGLAQAARVSALLDQTPSLLVTSNYVRAMQTAQSTIERFPNVPVEKWPVHEFTYLSPTLCQNSTQQTRRAMVDASDVIIH